MADELTSRRLAFGEFTLDAGDERLRGPAGPVKIGNKAFRVLVALVEQRGVLVTKDALFNSVWDGTIVTESALTSVIKELRRALGDESRTPRFIESAYGRGYRFIAPVVVDGADRTAAPQPVPTTPEHDGAEPPIVVVSEFVDSAIREHHPHCADQLREEVLSGLARFREIRLIADGDGSTMDFAREKPRGYRVSATLLPDASGVKVVARVSRLDDGIVIWAETLPLGHGGTASGVEKIVRRIIGSALPAVDADLYFAMPAVSGAFYDRYLRAKRHSLAPRTFAAARAAAEEFEQLIAERPDFGLSYPQLVRLYNTDFALTALGSSGPAERSRALELAKAGLAQDRANVHAYTVLAFCHLYNGQHSRARDCIEQALVLNPYNPVRLNEVAAAMIYLNEFDRAAELFEMGLQLQRFPDDSLFEDRGRLYLLTGDYAAAREELLAIAKQTIWSELYLALSELESGQGDGAGRFQSWLARVEALWHGKAQPTAAEIRAWVEGHHPFLGDGGALMFSALDRALSTAPVTPQVAALRTE